MSNRLRAELAHVLVRCLGRTSDEPLSIRPDSVGDHLAVTTFSADPSLLIALLGRSSPDERFHAMAVLTRASMEHTHSPRWRCLPGHRAGPYRPAAQGQDGLEFRPWIIAA